MRPARIKNRNTIRSRSQHPLFTSCHTGFPVKVVEHPIREFLNQLTYKTLAKLALTLRPLVEHLS